MTINGEEYNIIEVNNKPMLDELYGGNALTFEGTVINEDNLGYLVQWLNHFNCPMKKNDFYVIKGRVMNRVYKLTGSNAYPGDTNILCLKLSDLSNVGAIVLPRFQIGGRWFDDVVDNNARHQKEQGNEVYEGDVTDENVNRRGNKGRRQ